MKKLFVAAIAVISVSVVLLLIGCSGFDNFAGRLSDGEGGAEYSSRPLESAAPANLGQSSYEDFLLAILTFESSIDPKMAQEYHDKYNDPHAINYPKVDSPGRVVRDTNGDYVFADMSYQEYFKTLGIDDIYVPGSTDPEMFKRMQYSVINFLGFVGYQFSEQDLWFLNYYEHLDDEGYRMYYVDVPNSTWANGVRDKIIDFPDGPVHVTDVNTWKGEFIGKNGINSFEDFKDPYKQDFIARDHFSLKYGNIIKDLASTPGAEPLDKYLNTYLYWDQLTPSISPPPGGRSNQVKVTLSGLLAGAHLRGAQGVIDLLVFHKNPADEIGTTILQYVQDFGGYDTPFSTQ